MSLGWYLLLTQTHQWGGTNRNWRGDGNKLKTAPCSPMISDRNEILSSTTKYQDRLHFKNELNNTGHIIFQPESLQFSIFV